MSPLDRDATIEAIKCLSDNDLAQQTSSIYLKSELKKTIPQEHINSVISKSKLIRKTTNKELFIKGLYKLLESGYSENFKLEEDAFLTFCVLNGTE